MDIPTRIETPADVWKLMDALKYELDAIRHTYRFNQEMLHQLMTRIAEDAARAADSNHPNTMRQQLYSTANTLKTLVAESKPGGQTDERVLSERRPPTA